MTTARLKRFARAFARPLTSPLDGRVADINRRVGEVSTRVAGVGEDVGAMRREDAANATTVAESNTYTGVELRRLGESLEALQESLEEHSERIDGRLDALTERAYAERLLNAASAPLRPALDGRIELERPLVLIDVGCRWGVAEGWHDRGADLRVYAFDADEQECERLQATAPAGVTYVPVALGERGGSATLHVTSDPACSSLFAPDVEALAAFPELLSSTPVSAHEVELQTLDEWAADEGVSGVDAIKLDVQGAELAVLRGATAVLRDVRMLELEVTFNAIYEDQPLFGEVDAFLRDAGFQLWRLSHLVHYATAAQSDVDVKRVDRELFDSVPVDFPVGAGQLTWAHAHYCRPELIHGSWESPARALRDACAADLFGFQELVQPALAAAAISAGAGVGPHVESVAVRPEPS